MTFIILTFDATIVLGKSFICEYEYIVEIQNLKSRKHWECCQNSPILPYTLEILHDNNGCVSSDVGRKLSYSRH